MNIDGLDLYCFLSIDFVTQYKLSIHIPCLFKLLVFVTCQVKGSELLQKFQAQPHATLAVFYASLLVKNQQRPKKRNHKLNCDSLHLSNLHDMLMIMMLTK
jgi:hypothetical protein